MKPLVLHQLMVLLFVTLLCNFCAAVPKPSKLVQRCEKPAVIGNVFCQSDNERWTYKSEDEICVKLDGFSGCGQTENNFGSKRECKKACGQYQNDLNKRKKTYPDACKLPSGETGKCEALFHKYFYDRKTKSCKSFVYGGCGGNDNMFDSKAKCNHYCGRKLAKLP